MIEEAHGEMIQHFPKFPKPDSEEPSDTWIKSFQKRNDKKSLRSTNLEGDRIKMGTTANVREWFTKVYNLIDLTQYDERMIGNADESMLQTKSRLLCIVKRDERFALVREDNNSEHITILTLVTTNGDYMAPMLIFDLKHLPTNLDQLVKLGKIIWASQENGWIDKVNFQNWVKEVIKWVATRRTTLGLPNDAKFLLFLDGHSSRECSDTLKLFKDNFIDVCLFPSHCSHLLQPLDVGIFGPFKKYLKVWRRNLTRTEIKWTGDSIVSEKSEGRVKLVLAAINALHQSMTYTLVERGFRLSGIWPRDENQTLENPRIIENEEVTMKNTKRKRLPSNGGLITSDSIIQLVEEGEKETKKKKQTKK